MAHRLHTCTVWRVGSASFMRGHSVSTAPGPARAAPTPAAGEASGQKGDINWPALYRTYVPKDTSRIYVAVLTVIGSLAVFMWVSSTRESDKLDKKIDKAQETMTEKIDGIEKVVTKNSENIAVLTQKVESLGRQLSDFRSDIKELLQKQSEMLDKYFTRRWW